MKTITTGEVKSMNYETAAHFAETWGLVFLFVVFVAAVAYALWPDNKSKFDEAAQLPFRDDAE
jgi:cytochrome c oxidase cbb3-type subunit IV